MHFLNLESGYSDSQECSGAVYRERTLPKDCQACRLLTSRMDSPQCKPFEHNALDSNIRMTEGLSSALFETQVKGVEH